jgi:hypothetical protein
MHRTLVALGCGLTFVVGSAFAQQQGQNPKSANESSGPTVTERAKEAAQAIGEKTKEAVGKVKDMAQDANRKSEGDSRQGADDNGKTAGMQKKADADFKSAKTKCGSIQTSAQRTVCEKQAAVAHANAELRIAKANASGQASGQASGKTSTMGAGKSQ